MNIKCHRYMAICPLDNLKHINLSVNFTCRSSLIAKVCSEDIKISETVRL